MFASVPRVIKVISVNGSSVKRVSPVNNYVANSIEILLLCCIPVTVLVLTNAMMLRKFYQVRIIIVTSTETNDKTLDNGR